MKRIAIITGATGGLGSEFVKSMLDEKLDQIWVISRSASKLNKFVSIYGTIIIPIEIDLSDVNNLNVIKDMLNEDEYRIEYLVNNAGICVFELTKHMSDYEIKSLINVNITQIIILTNICLKYMHENSRIINISSASSFMPLPYLNVYSSTKVFVKNYSLSLRKELKKSKIFVTTVCPGWIKTNLIKETINGKKVKYPFMVTPSKVCKKAFKDAKHKKKLSIYGFPIKMFYLISKIVPQGILMSIYAKSQKKYYEGEKNDKKSKSV